MNEFMQFLIQYGYIVIFLLVFLDQAGLPLPAIPVLLTAGALAGTGQLGFWAVVMTTMAACVPIDLVWYYLGRLRGGKVLNLLCSISLEPDYCVRNTEAAFDRLGRFALVIAKFVPGLQTIAPPMAGMTGMTVPRFLVLDTLGAFVWAGSITYVGYWFNEELTIAAAKFAEFGVWAGVILGGALAAYIAMKFVQRRIFLRSLRMRMMHPEEVHEKLNAGGEVHVIDLRHHYDFEQLPHTVPSALRIPMEAIERHYHRIPKNGDIILYCS